MLFVVAAALLGHGCEADGLKQHSQLPSDRAADAVNVADHDDQQGTLCEVHDGNQYCFGDGGCNEKQSQEGLKRDPTRDVEKKETKKNEKKIAKI